MNPNRFSVQNMVYCAISAALMAVCAWLSIPLGAVTFTMQTFAVFFTLGLLGGRRGTVAVLIYLVLGTVGLPVFSGFRGGVSALLDATGGFLWGFLAAALLYWILTSLRCSKIVAMAAGLAACYVCGTAWFFCTYAPGSVWAVLMTCVFPYLIPDTLKLILANYLSARLSKAIRMH